MAQQTALSEQRAENVALNGLLEKNKLSEEITPAPENSQELSTRRILKN